MNCDTLGDQLILLSPFFLQYEFLVIMIKKVFYLLDASLITLVVGLFVLPINASSDSLKLLTHLKEAQWENNIVSSKKASNRCANNSELSASTKSCLKTPTIMLKSS
jgi:hypothetical protein